ncbi:MAG: cobalt ECF transporter T component CbiQ [Nitrososphaerales archaeon]
MLSSFLKTFEDIVNNERFSSLNGFIQSIDPRVKIFSFTAFILVAITARSITSLMILIMITFLLSITSKIPLKFFIIRTSFTPMFVAVIALPLLFITPGNSIFTISYYEYLISITMEGVYKTLQFTLRVWACVNSLILLVLTTRFSNLVHAMERFKVPRVFTMMGFITYRFIFLLINEAYRMVLARESRIVKKESKLKAMKSLASMISTLFIRSYERGGRVYLAMIARGYKGSMKSLSKTNIDSKDVVFVFTIIAISIIILSTEYLLKVV